MANQNKEKRNQSEINVIDERERGSDQVNSYQFLVSSVYFAF